MKRSLFIIFLLIFFVQIGVVLIGFGGFAAAESVWQYGRIESVKKSVTTTTKVWVVNTPVDEEVTKYTIAVHVQDRIIFASYDLSPSQSEPPPVEWTSGAPVKIEIAGESLFLRSPTGSLRLHISQRKPAGPMKPVTLEEKKELSALEAGPELPHSMIGFSKPSDEKADEKAAEAVQPPPPAPPSTGSVTVRSTPFLSEVFVDGDSMGYTPAKIALGPGKHTFRVEKPGYKTWTKEMTLTIGSELTLDATLDRK
jgi:PEGA domain